MDTQKHEFNSRNVSKSDKGNLELIFCSYFVLILCLNCTKLDELRICFLGFCVAMKPDFTQTAKGWFSSEGID